MGVLSFFAPRKGNHMTFTEAITHPARGPPYQQAIAASIVELYCIFTHSRYAT
jgi:hypothetical protein